MKKPEYYWESLNISHLVHNLLNHHVFITSTDTTLGLLTLADAPSIDRLNTIKKRPVDTGKPYVVLIGSLAQLSGFVSAQSLDSIISFIQSRWPAPLTIVAPARADLPWRPHQSTIALRMPNHEGLQVLSQKTGGLFSTSANISGAPIPTRVHEIDPQIMSQVSGVITEKNQDEYPIIPSTIVDVTGSDYRIIRQGIYQINK